MSSKNPKWHSRRYETPEQHDTARANYEVRKEEKKRSALERQEVASKRTPQEQLDRLDQLLGFGLGANKERAKLLKKVSRLPTNIR